MLVEPGVGTTLAEKYAIESVLGEGGMGIVYRAAHLGLDRAVAIKCLHPRVARDKSALKRFADEAKAVGRLKHPNVIDVYDLALDHDPPFMVLELLEGQSLADQLEARGRLSVEETLTIVEPLLDALAAAHEAGIVHRDIKPENIFIADEAGRTVPKLLDFGIAKLLGDGKSATATGAAVGSPAYMAPEQVRGEVGKIGPHTDVWAMGVVLFECMAGRLHYDVEPGAGAMAWIAKVATERPRRLSEVAPELPHQIAAAVDRALESEPEHRTPTVQALAASLRASPALGNARAVLPVTLHYEPPPAVRQERLSPWWLALAAGLGALVVLGIAFSLGFGGSVEPPAAADDGLASPAVPPPSPDDIRETDTTTPPQESGVAPGGAPVQALEVGVSEDDDDDDDADDDGEARGPRPSTGTRRVRPTVTGSPSRPPQRTDEGTRTRTGPWRIDDL